MKLVEQLGSGIPHILKHYKKESFNFSENFLRMTLVPNITAVNVDDKSDNTNDGETGGAIGSAIGSVIGSEIGGVIEESTKLTKRQKKFLNL